MKKVLSIVVVGLFALAAVALVSGCKCHHWKGHEGREHGMRTATCPCCGKMMPMHPMMMHRMHMGMCPMCGAPVDKEHMKAMMEKMGVKEMAQTTCPITGKPINKQFFIDHMGKRIYFCSAACIDEFKKNPEKCMAKMKEMGQMCEPAPGATAAPVPGAPAP